MWWARVCAILHKSWRHVRLKLPSPRKLLHLKFSNSNFPARQCQEFTFFSGLHGLPSYEINIIIYYISYFCRMVDHGLMVDRQKIETNVAYNFFCSLALKDFNNHLIFTVVDKKRNNWTVLLKTAITPLHIKCHCVTDTGVKMNVWQHYLQVQV